MSIPVFPQFKLLELNDKEEVESYLQKFPSETSDFTFTNLFIWRNYDHPKLTIINGNLCVLMSPQNSLPYFLPPVGDTKIEETIQNCFGFLKDAPQMRMVPEKFVKKYFEKNQYFRITADRNNFDYLYRTCDLINLKGRKYDGKRNWIKRFSANYLAKSKYFSLTSDLLPVCFDLLERWGKTRSEEFLNYEIMAIKDALNNLDFLRLTGRAILISDKLEAFMVAGLINFETAIVYIQVANRQVQGLPQYFHQKFTSQELSQYKYVNWEQDLGLPGLRRAKLSYQPKCLISKYNVGRV